MPRVGLLTTLFVLTAAAGDLTLHPRIQVRLGTLLPLLVAAAAVWSARRARWRDAVPLSVLAMTGLIASTAVVALHRAPDALEGRAEVQGLLAGLAITVATLALTRGTSAGLTALRRGWVLALGLAVVVGAIELVTDRHLWVGPGLSWATTSRTIIAGAFRNPNDFALALTAMISAVLVHRSALPRAARAAHGALAALVGAGLVGVALTESRSGLLAGVLVLFCLVLLLVEAGARGRARYARVGSGSARRPEPVRLGAWTPLVATVIATVVVLSTGVPVFVLARWLLIGGAGVWRNPDLWPAVAQSLGYGLYGSAGCVLLALPVAGLSIRYPGAVSRLVEATSYVTSSLPGIVVALALTTISVRVLPEVYQTVWLVLMAYVLLYIPRAVVTLRAGLAQAPVRLEEAARSLGRSPVRAVMAVTLPRLLPAVFAAFALVFLAVVTELTATLLLSPAGTATLATRFWALSLDLDYAAAAPFAAVMVALSAPMTFLLLRHSAAEER